MGYLLKEALKSLCGINQWSYAVFWKIGCQNPKLLIWEDCYYEPVTSSALYHASKVGNQSIPLEELQSCWVSPNVSDTQSQDPVGERVRLLIDKMMTNQVHVVGEGLVGRAAFTGAHQWIVSGSYNENAHPPEVVSEINLQFSAGMQTIAVIPIVPHGVVQLGSSLAMTVNIVFVHEVKNLILQLGCISSTLMPDNYMTNEPDEKIGIPVAYNASVTGVPYIDLKGKNCRSMLVGSDLQNESVQTSKSFIQPSNSMFDQVADHLQKDTSGLHISNPSRDVSKSHGYSNQPKNNVLSDAKLQNKGMLGNKVPGTEVIPMLSQALLSQQTKCSMGARFTNAVPSGLCRNPHLMEQTLGCVTGSQGGINRTLGKSAGFATPQPPNSSRGSCAKLLPGKSSVCGEHNSQGISAPRPANTSVSYMLSNEEACLSNVVDQFNTNCMLSGCSDNVCHRAQYIPKEEQIDLYKVHGLPFADSKESTLSNDVIQGPLLKFHGASQLPTGRDSLSGDIYAHSSAGDDLFDVLGKDFKNKLLNGLDCTAWEELGANTNNLNKYPPRSVDLQDMGSSFYSSCRGMSDSGIFSGSVSGSGVASDHLLDAVVSGIHSASRQASDDNVSCHTTVTNISSSSVPSNSGTCGRVSMSSNMEEEFYGCAMPVVGFQEAGIMPIKSGFGKNGTENCSVSSSFYGSKISSWIEQGPSAKRESSISTANSKKPIEAGKTNRKRLKPGENPRPRPKDRQMIQDRVKELREIVPNGAKCSIDALLERTVKHMLFLQSVTKHADKLRQTMESKIISKDGLLLKDNFEGGATWAFEVGSQSMVCPIIVEDLNPPRQLLVEMLCEERGFFLEIADIIRGLGLTILKGIMESRNDKIWARFAVEANRDVTRMEIFISLVHVLEQTVKGSTGLASADNDDNVAVHPTFHHQATSSMPAKEQMVGPVSRSETSAI